MDARERPARAAAVARARFSRRLGLWLGRCMASDRRFLVGLRAADRPKLAPRRDDDASDDDDDDDDEA